jgi:cation:H+ antiporter
MNDWLNIGVGLVLLTAGAEALVRGASTLARRLGMSELLIGLTLVGFGTSTPELVSSLQAAFQGSPGIAVGNIVGSNIANLLLILGVSAAITPFMVDLKGLRRDGFVVLVATLAAIAVSMSGEFSRIAGLAFTTALLGYIAYAFVSERGATNDSDDAGKHGPNNVVVDLVLVAAGFGLLVFGAKLLVGGAINIAEALGISQTIIGLTVVAIGTSLPELATSITAALRGKSALALGNVLGSNIYNILGILGVTAAIHPIAAPEDIVRFDNWVMLGATILMLVLATTRRKLDRTEGLVMVALFGGYIAMTVLRA